MCAARQVTQAGNAAALGRLMTDSYVSQRDDFNCSCEEIDFLVDTAHTLAGCHRAHLTSGGFGGCMVSIVAKEEAGRFLEQLSEAYRSRYEIVADAWICTAEDGAYELAEEGGAL